MKNCAAQTINSSKEYLKHNNKDILEIETFSKEKGSELDTGKPEIVIINGHNGKDLSAFPNQQALNQFLQEPHKDYIDLEADNGITELSNCTAIQLAQMGYKVRVINVLYPRAALDSNREIQESLLSDPSRTPETPESLEPLTNSEEFGPAFREILPKEFIRENWDELVAIHQATVDKIEEVLKSLPTGSVVLDLHSMIAQNTTSPTKDPGNSPEEIDEFINSKTGPGHIKSFRTLALISSDQQDAPEIKQGSPAFYQAIQKILKEENLPFRMNFPYMLIPGIMSNKWAQLCKDLGHHYFIADFAAWMLSELFDLEEILKFRGKDGNFDHERLRKHLREKLTSEAELKKVNMNLKTSDKNLEILARILAKAADEVLSNS